MYFDEPGAAPASEGHEGIADPHFRWLLSVNALLLLVLGLTWDSLMHWCQRAFLI